jgi:hypothetical protein
MNLNQLRTRALHEHNHAVHLSHDNERMREALRLIADMAEHSPSAMAMTDIARIARSALLAVPRENMALRHPGKPEGIES